MKKLALGLFAFCFCAFVMAGCEENYKLPVTIYTTENESIRQTTDITCMVKQMYTAEHKYGYAFVPNAKTNVVKTCYVVLKGL